MNSKQSSPWICYRCRHKQEDIHWSSQRRPKPRRADRVLRFFMTGATLFLAWILALLISCYDPAWNRRRSSQPRGSGRVSFSDLRRPKPSDAPNIPPWIRHPSPAVFAIAWAIFALSAATIYHLQRHDRHQNQILAVTVASGILGGFLLSEQNFVAVVGTHLPLCVSLGLFLSILAHGLRRPQAEIVEEEGQQVNGLNSEKEQLRA